MIFNTDPTYLRTIYDGLNNGSLHKVNATSLPIGLVGIYEDAIPPESSINERKRFLDFFAVWAFLKKEVSLEFILPLLEGWTEVQLIDYIAKYSKWFNSPVSGKYQIYHERFRSFIFQKISDKQFALFNNLIINYCKKAIQIKGGDEWERYALEYMSLHLLISAMENGDDQLLKSFAYNSAHWNRQLQISKGFDWSKKMLNDMMIWASKYNVEEVILCAINKVELHHQEQNDAPHVIDLIAHNEIDIALQRIETFGGNDQEGLQRKFILYSLCLMELTLLHSKEKTFRKDAIDKLLKHLDEHIPLDNSIFNWNDFFPSYTMFQMACEWAELGLDYLILYKRKDSIIERAFFVESEKDWLNQNGPYTSNQFELLCRIARVNPNDYQKIWALINISSQLAKQKRNEDAETLIEEAFDCALSMSDEYAKNKALSEISIELAKQSRIEKAIECMLNITAIFYKDSSLRDISIILAEQGNINQAIEFARSISDEIKMSCALKEISSVLAKQNNILLALETCQEIQDNYWKSLAFISISTELSKHGMFEEEKSVIEQTIDCLNGVTSDILIKNISNEIAKKGRFVHALNFTKSITDDFQKSQALICISSELFNQRKPGEAKEILDQAIVLAKSVIASNQKNELFSDISKLLAKKGDLLLAIEFSKNISDKFLKVRLFTSISSEFFNQGNFNDAAFALEKSLELALEISDESEKSSSLLKVSNELFKQGNFEDSAFVLEQAIVYARFISQGVKRNRAIKSISTELIIHGKVEAVSSAMIQFLERKRGIISNDEKSSVLNEISIQQAKHGEINLAIKCASSIIIEEVKGKSLKDISSELAKLGMLADASNLILQSYEFTTELKTNHSYRKKGHLLMDIASELAKQGKFDNAIECGHSIQLDYYRSLALKSISSELAKQDKIVDAAFILEEAKKYTQGIILESEKSIALMKIAIEFANQSNIIQALDCCEGIQDYLRKCNALSYISSILSTHGNPEDAEAVMEQAYQSARSVVEDGRKIWSLLYISSELSKQGRIEAAKYASDEAIECAQCITDCFQKYFALKDISSELSSQSRKEEATLIWNEAIQCARAISLDREKGDALKGISIELFKQKSFEYAEKIGLEIPLNNIRQICWKTLADLNIKDIGWQKSLQQINNFKTEEARLFYLKGWVEAISIQEVNNDCVMQAIGQNAIDSEIIETLMQKHAIHEVFFGNADREKLNHLNKSLNIQWAIDIKNN